MKLLRYTLVILGSLFILDFGVSKIMDSVYNQTFTGMTGGNVNYLIKKVHKIPILAVGDSRCAHHVKPSVLDSGKVYNLSHNGMSLNFHIGIVDQLIAHKKIEIDTLLLHIELKEFFEGEDFISSDIQHLKNYFRENEWIRNEILSISKYEAIKHLFSSYKYNGKYVSLLVNRLKTAKSSPPTDGYVAKNPTSRDSVNVTWQYNSILKQNKEVDIKKLKISNRTKNYIRHVKEICDKAGITLICFSSPYYKPSDDIAPKSELIKKFFSDEKISYLDYSNMFNSNAEIQSIWNWNDANHLNENGAIIFTGQLKKDLFK